MNAKTLYKGAFCLSAAVFSLCATSFAATGDYQLYRANVWSKVEGKNVDKLFMINTSNGKAWELDEVLDDTTAEKTIIRGWRSLEKDIKDEEQKIKETKADALEKATTTKTKAV
ncbi:MAG: hypothetical protein A2007_04440 [Verrucomicrobia bacterium GWC2_42_7]|nr:MAG: hypothetical protein A2007_04440 [Verrucomicrobia bacterium GWC2_42_7]